MTQPPYNPSNQGEDSNWQAQPANTESTDSQPGYPQYQQQQPYGANAGQYGGYMAGGYAPPPKTQGITITAMVLGIISVFFGAIPVFGLLVGAAAVIVSVMALSRKAHSRGMSIAGLITGIVGLLIGLLVTIMLFTGLSMMERIVNDPSFQQEIEQQFDELEKQDGSIGGGVKDD